MIFGNVPSVKKPKIRNKLFDFAPASEDEVRKIIMKSASKSCDLDPIPTNTLKALLDILIKPITTIIHLSLESRTFPLSFKEAHGIWVFFLQWLNFRQHFSQVSSSCIYHITDLKRIRKNLPLDLAKQIAVALVTSKLDYCNSLLHVIPAKDLQKLQRVENCFARVVTKVPRFSRSIPLLKSLHWLPIKFRIQVKICTFVWCLFPSTLLWNLTRLDCASALQGVRRYRSFHFIPSFNCKDAAKWGVAAPTLSTLPT